MIKHGIENAMRKQVYCHGLFVLVFEETRQLFHRFLGLLRRKVVNHHRSHQFERRFRQGFMEYGKHFLEILEDLMTATNGSVMRILSFPLEQKQDNI